MDHAAAHERLADLALEPGAIVDAVAGAPEHADLREHLAGCQACRAELTTLAALRDGLDDALAGATLKGFEAAGTLKGFDAAAFDPIEPPEGLRAAVLAAARRPAAEPPVVTIAASRARIGLVARLAVAAALVLAVGAGGFALGAGSRAPQGTADAGRIALVAAVDRILATTAKDRWVAPLVAPDGSAAGSVSWSRRDFVVLTSALAPAPAGHIYRCWLVTGGETSSIGAMDIDGAMAYWVGSVDEWAGVEIGPGARMIVTLEAAGAPGSAPTGAPLLMAEL